MDNTSSKQKDLIKIEQLTSKINSKNLSHSRNSKRPFDEFDIDDITFDEFYEGFQEMTEYHFDLSEESSLQNSTTLKKFEDSYQGSNDYLNFQSL